MTMIKNQVEDLNISNENVNPTTPTKPRTPLKDHNVSVKADRPVKVSCICCNSIKKIVIDEDSDEIHC